MPQPRLRRGMTLKSQTQPHLRCGMMLYISLPLPILFLPWVTSGEYKWVTLAERRSSIHPIASVPPNYFSPGVDLLPDSDKRPKPRIDSTAGDRSHKSLHRHLFIGPGRIPG